MRLSPWGAQLAVFYEDQVEHLHDADRLLPLLKELAWLRGMDESEIPTELPELDRLPELFHRLKLPFSDCHICAWHAAINSSLEAEGLSAIANGIQNLVRRKWKSVEPWLQGLPTAAGARSSRTIDGLIENRAILPHDLMELITLLGIEKAAPAMRYLVGLGMASESQVIIHLAETTPAVRTELSMLFRAENDSNFDADSATAHLYDLLPGIDIPLVHRAKADILRRLAAPQTSLGSEPITEGRVLDWLEHIPKYCPRLGMLTELAKKAQQAGLNPMWAVAMMKDVRAKRSE
jgi:hypothetical protein